MTRRSMPCLFHANLFALDVARWLFQDIGVALAVKRPVQGAVLAGRRKFLKKVLALSVIVRIINFVA